MCVHEINFYGNIHLIPGVFQKSTLLLIDTGQLYAIVVDSIYRLCTFESLSLKSFTTITIVTVVMIALNRALNFVS
jgi:hypothetical protein